MKIEKVTNEIKRQYPSQKTFNTESLKNYIPKKWYTVGVTSVLFNYIMSNKVFATNDSDSITHSRSIIAGLEPSYYEPVYYKYAEMIASASIIIFIISVIGILYIKIKSKKQNKTFKIEKIIKITLILSIVIYVLANIVLII